MFIIQGFIKISQQYDQGARPPIFSSSFLSRTVITSKVITGTMPEVVPVITSKVPYCVPFCYDSRLLASLGQRNLCPRVNTAVI
jgi:hypothetical protein